LTNCALFANESESPIDDFSQQVRVSYSLLEPSVTGYTSGPGNLTTTVSPFASTTSTQLKGCSPAINAGDPATTTATIGSTDLAGNPRFFNDGRVDMGAYEFQDNPTAITVSSPAVTTAIQGQPFSQSFTASGGQTPYSFSLASGNLPPGLSLTTTGVLSGTPTQTGSFTLAVRATDNGGCSGGGNVYTLTVTAPVVQCPTGDVTLSSQAQVDAFPTGCFVVPGKLTISGADITDLSPLASLTSVGGFLSIDSNPLLTNVSGLSGLRQVGSSLVIASNTALPNLSGLESLASIGDDLIILNNPSLTSVSGLSALRQVGEDLEISLNGALISLSGVQSLTNVGRKLSIYDNPQLSLCATEPICRLLATLPANRKDISNNAPGCATLAEVEANCAGPAITGFAASPNPVCAGSSVSFTATVSNVVTPYSFTLTNGSSPLSGTANMSAFSQMLTASGSGAQSFTLTVSASGRSTTAITSVTVNAVTVTNPAVSTAMVGVAFGQSFVASGGTAPYSFSVVSSNLPPSLSLSSAGVLSGTPTEAGSYSVLVTASDANGCSGTGTTYELTVRPSSSFTVVQAPANQTACVGSRVTFSVRVAPDQGVTYAWFKNSADPRQPIQATTPDYTVEVTDGGKAGRYIVRITGADGTTVEQRELVLTVNQRPVSPPPTSTRRQLCPEASPVNLGQYVSRTNNSYLVRYYQSTGQLLASSSVVLDQPGTYAFSATQVDPATGCESVPTSFTLTVNPATQLVSNPAGQTVCSGSTVTLTVQATGSNLRYEWFRGSVANQNKLFENASRQTGTTTASLTLVRVSQSEPYYVRVTGDCGVVVSGAIAVTVQACGARQGVSEAVEPGLQVRVLGNPTAGEWMEVALSGVGSESVRLVVSDERGHVLSEQGLAAGQGDGRHRVALGPNGGVYLLRVSTPSRQQVVKLLKH